MSAHAQVIVDYDEILSFREKLLSSYAIGFLIHQKYDFYNLDDLKDCVNNYGHLRDELKTIREKIMKLNSIAYRFNLVMAADSAFTCVYCGGTGESCPNILIEMEEIDEMLIEAGKLAP
jgi:ferredoxin